MNPTLGRDIKPSALVAAAISLQGKWTSNSLGKELWRHEFRAMEPKAIYQHNVNTVIVLREDDSPEDGIYVLVPWSSFHPVNGEGWEFKGLGTDVWQYSRRESWR